MKKTMILFVLLLTSCQMISNNKIKKSLTPIKAFEISAQCSHVCWQGINPGLTTTDEAKLLVSTSDQIDKNTLQISESGIYAVWFTGPFETSPWRVGIQFEKGLVRSMSFGGGDSPFRMDDFVTLLGQPDEISINSNETADAQYIEYIVYYLAQRAAIFISPGSMVGPSTQDKVSILILNIEFDSKYTPRWLIDGNKFRQTWLGYGHLRKYSPAVETPPPSLP